MPNTSGSSKKQNAETISKNVSGTTNYNKHNSSNNNNSGCSEKSPSSCSSNLSVSSKARKRKRSDVKCNFSEFESEFDDCNLEDAIAIEKKLRKVAKNNSLSDDEMRKLLQKFVKNEHVLALVTLKAEDEVARERREAEQRAIIITDTPSVAKLTRSKAKELNKSPGISLPPLKNDAIPQMEIATLINDDLHSDEEDEEYTFKEEDFVSDDDPNTTVSDFDSNPCTPQTPYTNTEYEDSPVKFTDDGCFKIPLDKPKETEEDLRIAARTRSKLCLQQTTIEDIQSKFIPPDVDQLELHEMDLTATDDDWMQFLNDFSKPLNSSIICDDDDPINDPEYVAAEKEPVDAEELRDVNISKKELTELVAELFEGLLNENLTFESVDLETPQKFLAANCSNVSDKDVLNTPHVSPQKVMKSPNGTTVCKGISSFDERTLVARTIDFDNNALTCTENTYTLSSYTDAATATEYSVYQNNVTSSVSTMSSPPPLVPIPVAQNHRQAVDHISPCKTISIPQSALNSQPELIAVPVPGKPNCYQLAKVATAREASLINEANSKDETATRAKDTRYTTPYDANFTWEYISIRRHVYSEYMNRFENLRYEKPQNEDQIDAAAVGFTAYQHDLLQQQLRIHVQMLAQNYLQTYCHPEFWKLAAKPKEMLLELQEKAKTDASFNARNLNDAVDLITKWEQDLSVDNEENRELMNFIHREIELTNRNTRQIPRFPPRIVELVLDSDVFMYPQYLPRIPFTSKVLPYHVFSPAESYLLAIGLEKHLQHARENKVRLPGKHDPFDVACKRLSKDTIFGKSKRRIVDQIRRLQNEDYYNPIKYFFDHNRAPKIEQSLITFVNNTVPVPRQRFDELPFGWQKYITEQNSEPEVIKPTKSKSRRKSSNATLDVKSKKTHKTTSPIITASEKARLSYLEFVREAVGEDISLPENLTEAVEPTESATAKLPPAIVNNALTPTTTRCNQDYIRSKAQKKALPKSLTINVNYVFGTNIPTSNTNANISGTTFTPCLTANNTSACNNSSLLSVSNDFSNNWSQLIGSTPQVLPTLPYPLPTPSVEPGIRAIDYTFDFTTQQLRPAFELSAGDANNKDSSQRKLTDFYELEEISPSKNWRDIDGTSNTPRRKRNVRRRLRKIANNITCLHVAKRNKIAAAKYRQKRKLQRRCYDLITTYRYNLELHVQLYSNKPLVQRIYVRLKALELYTNLLKELNIYCRSVVMNGNNANSASTNAANSPTNVFKRSRASISNQLPDDDGSAATRSKKANRQEEYLRQMLMPDTQEEANRKDAIYAFNFYEKVEEVLMASNRPDDCKKFNMILKNFDPSCDKVSDLYFRMEKLFLPDHPELAQVFLTFLLPSEAAEIGKFFEHFMITNAHTFINKLNIYFNKQPAQIRKIYNCLNELAEDPDVNMKKVETRILPLLKGNQFLIDWFLQQFPEATPPERILPAPETVNLKEVNNTQPGEFMEHVTDLLESPTQDQQGCQLRYINGRIFYGSKFVLPAKLSFMANYLSSEEQSTGVGEFDAPASGCVHGIREQGEKRLAEATAAEANAAAAECCSDDNEKSEEEDTSKAALVIDTTAGEDDSCSSIETCDEATLRAHAMRLNPNYYTSAMFSNSLTSTPNPANSLQQHHANARKSSLNFNDDVLGGQGKLSPRKHGADIRTVGVTALTNTPTACASPNNDAQQIRDKRKSPIKKVKSPLCGIGGIAANKTQARVNLQPMVVIHEQSPTIACSRKLKSLIDEDINEVEANEEHDNKDRISIVARAKHDVLQFASEETTETTKQAFAKLETEDDLERTAAGAVFVKTDIESSAEEDSRGVTARTHNVVTQFDSDEDCKLDVVTTLANDAAQAIEPTTASDERAQSSTQPPKMAQWTRDEDKIILIEMKLSASTHNRSDLLMRIQNKLQQRSLSEIAQRHQFLMDFLAKLQGK